jgi:hypothetical protein
LPGGGRVGQAATEVTAAPAAVTWRGNKASVGAAAITCPWCGPFCIWSGRAGNTPAAGCPPRGQRAGRARDDSDREPR